MPSSFASYKLGVAWDFGKAGPTTTVTGQLPTFERDDDTPYKASFVLMLLSPSQLTSPSLTAMERNQLQPIL